ncbi:restriction endonuclease subunit S [Marinobacterium iners]|uniref:Type I restriction enzyme, S subunit n=1 Tax=Marinobacterium iners DSM 11526 TaxID=1122198 RepID=A0A1H4FRQ2_9GAMM|nr:restriction endonuclease subunit S [Marinobacterium iners]SEA99348.1 type I restriction enzyme, S subunit [Marinobacterium iners DSM 11526]
MSKQKKGLVPELRFPEFEKEPNWPCVQLNAVARRSTSKNKGEKVSRVLTNSAIDGVVDQRDYFEKDIAVKGNLESYYIVDKGDYVYNPRISSTAPVGPISKNKVGKGVMSPLYTVFNFNSKKNDFFEQFFKSSRWHGYLQTISNSGARHDRMSITSGEFMAMPVPNPSDMEQQKIADCLASVDELITLHTQKLNTLKDHRKGLMQQLFPAEGETVPKLRFPEFKGKESWVALQLQDFSTIIRGASPRPKGDPRYYGGSVPRLMGQDVSRDGKWVTPCIDYLTDEGAKLSRFCKKGTLTIICSGDVGVPSFLSVDACIHDGFLALTKINSKVINKEFLYYCLVNLYSVFNDSATHGGIYINLTTSILKEFQVSIPESLEEQGSIVSVLAAVDDLIAAQDSYLSDLKNHKVGLMQKLFPVMDNAV